MPQLTDRPDQSAAEESGAESGGDEGSPVRALAGKRAPGAGEEGERLVRLAR